MSARLRPPRMPIRLWGQIISGEMVWVVSKFGVVSEVEGAEIDVSVES
jgi:hypothetical protein